MKKIGKMMLLSLLFVMVFASVMPQTARAADTKVMVVKVKGKNVNKKTVCLNKKDQAKISVSNVPKKAKITYKSSNKKVVTVTKGTMKAVGKGTAKITVKAKKKTVNFTVKVSNTGMKSVNLTYKGETKTGQIKNGQTIVMNDVDFAYMNLVPEVKPSNVKTTMTFTYDRKMVCIMGHRVYPKLPGRSKVTVTIKDETGKKKVITFTVDFQHIPHEYETITRDFETDEMTKTTTYR